MFRRNEKWDCWKFTERTMDQAQLGWESTIKPYESQCVCVIKIPYWTINKNMTFV